MEIVGWIGSVLLSICGLPLAIQSFRAKNSDSINSSFLYIWTFGEVFSLIYLLSLGEGILLWNYIINLIFLSIIIFYKIKPTR